MRVDILGQEIVQGHDGDIFIYQASINGKQFIIEDDGYDHWISGDVGDYVLRTSMESDNPNFVGSVGGLFLNPLFGHDGMSYYFTNEFEGACWDALARGEE